MHVYKFLTDIAYQGWVTEVDDLLLADRSPPSSDEGKNGENIPALPPINSHIVVLN
jgi:hypothetical protein